MSSLVLGAVGTLLAAALAVGLVRLRQAATRAGRAADRVRHAHLATRDAAEALRTAAGLTVTDPAAAAADAALDAWLDMPLDGDLLVPDELPAERRADGRRRTRAPRASTPASRLRSDP